MVGPCGDADGDDKDGDEDNDADNDADDDDNDGWTGEAIEAWWGGWSSAQSSELGLRSCRNVISNIEQKYCSEIWLRNIVEKYSNRILFRNFVQKYMKLEYIVEIFVLKNSIVGVFGRNVIRLRNTVAYCICILALLFDLGMVKPLQNNENV